MSDDPHTQDVATLVAASDELVRRVEATIARLETEVAPAAASGDDRYIRRVERGLARSRALLDVLDEGVLSVLMDLRHNAAQLGYARHGKMV